MYTVGKKELVIHGMSAQKFMERGSYFIFFYLVIFIEVLIYLFCVGNFMYRG